MTDDPTLASIEAQNAERDRLRFENARLGTALTEALVAIEAFKAENIRLTAEHESAFGAGYDQAVHEIRGHFAKAGDHDVAHVIEDIWKISFEKKARTS